jgi:hypothetical protein
MRCVSPRGSLNPALTAYAGVFEKRTDCNILIGNIRETEADIAEPPR